MRRKGNTEMSVEAELSERKLTILKAIIQNYLETGELVGSRTLSKYTDLKLSSATIRNEMADLKTLVTSSSRIHQQEEFHQIRDIAFM